MLASESGVSHWCQRNSGFNDFKVWLENIVYFMDSFRVTEQRYRWPLQFPKYKSIEKNNIWGCGIYGDITAFTSLSFSHDYSVIL